MAKILFLSVLLSVLLTFHVTSGDAGWVLTSPGLDQLYLLSHDYASMDLCKVLLKLHVRLPTHLSVIITECSMVSIKAVLKPNVAVHLFICADLRVQVAPFIYARIEVTARLVLRIGRHGLYVHGCGIVDIVIKARSLLFTDAIAQLCLDGLIRLLSGPFCERGRAWCREMNYCLDISPNPYPVSSSCYGVWRNKPPRVADDELDLHSHPVCTCREMEGAVSVNIEVMLALAIITSPKDQAYFFIHEKDISYIFECMRKGRSFNGLQTLVSLSIGRVEERFPKLSGLCLGTAQVVLKIECTRISVDLQPGHASLCVRLRIHVGCDASNFTSFLTFSLIGCLNLYLNVDCHRELLLVSVSLGSAFRIKTTCTEGEECEGDQGALQEIFLEPLTAWLVNQINVVVKGGIHLPSLIGYPCDSCEQTVYLRRRAYCGCRLKYVHK